MPRRKRQAWLFGVIGLTLAVGAVGGALPSTSSDFKETGTQARTVMPPQAWMVSDPVLPSSNCFTCHAGADDPTTTVKPFRWRGSMHAHAYRDPIFQAAFVIAGQDAPGSGEACIRCHAPRGWLEGRATPPTGNPNGSTLFFSDTDDGVTCNVCHRLVDPVYKPGISPPDDTLILNALAAAPGGSLVPSAPGNARMVVDPMDVRRGPFADAAAPHLFLESPLHKSGDLCGTCHDASNPLMSRVGGSIPAPSDTYTLTPFNAQHPTQNKLDQFPEQRTYSEWKNSAFANGGVDMGGRFGGNITVVSQCQDCHMPPVTGFGCYEEIFAPPLRNDLPYHSFAAANVFAIDLLLNLYTDGGPDDFDQYTVASLSRARNDTLGILQNATDTAATQFAGELNVRVTNQCGHKLLTGMPEGRRIWQNIRFFNGPTLIQEIGAYNAATGDLATGGAKVYEQTLGLDPYMAAQTGLPAGPSFHLMLANTVLKDNRIPPRGFTNSAFRSVQAGHVAYSYPDAQYWDDTKLCIPAGATRAEVKLYYQTASKEYIQFLRDANTTDGRGLLLYNAWAAVGRNAPVVMDDVAVNLAPFVSGDVTGDGVVSFADITKIFANWGRTGNIGQSGGDTNCDGAVNFADITTIFANWGAHT